MGGFGGRGGGDFFLEQYAKRIIITNHHTKFELNSSKHLGEIPLKKSGNTDTQTKLCIQPCFSGQSGRILFTVAN